MGGNPGRVQIPGTLQTPAWDLGNCFTPPLPYSRSAQGCPPTTSSAPELTAAPLHGGGHGVHPIAPLFFQLFLSPAASPELPKPPWGQVFWGSGRQP